MSKLKSIFLFTCILVGGLLASSTSAKVPTPQIYNVVPSSENSYRPWVVGWTPNEVEVEVLMDEVAVGMAKVVPNESGTASFGWAPQEDLPIGFHQFRIRGLSNGQYSEPGGILGFTVKPPVPAPILVEPEQFDDHILIKGLIKNNMSVKIFVDNILQADFVVPNHPSGTTNFWFKSKDLLNGLHEVSAVAYYQDGSRVRASKNSSTLSFKTEQQKLTKGDDNVESIVIEVGENKDVVINKETEGDVKIVKVDENSDVKVVSDQENTEDIVIKEKDTEELDLEGEISSIEEISDTEEQVPNDNIATDNDRERKNRKVGLVILGIMIIILIAWYAVERKKAGEEDEDEDKKDEVNQEKEEENDSDDQQELDLDGDKDKE